MLGISYNHPLFQISGDGTMSGLYDLGQLGFLVGAGVDYNLTSTLFLRGEGLFHLRAPFWGTMDVITQSGVKIDLGMGPRIKVGVGYRL
jgi:opacity protein-like surface antigen